MLMFCFFKPKIVIFDLQLYKTFFSSNQLVIRNFKLSNYSDSRHKITKAQLWWIN